MKEIRKELFFSKLSAVSEQSQEKTVYHINPEYGSGFINNYRIIEGMYLNYSEFHITGVLRCCTNKPIKSEFIKFEYCLEGVWTCSKENKVIIGNKGTTAYYAGKNRFNDLDFKNLPYKSINVICYLDAITDSIASIFGSSKEKVMDYFHKLSKREDALVKVTDDQITPILNDIYKFIKCDNLDLIKLRIIELFLMEINNYDNYNGTQKKYYTKSVIQKVNSIRNTIDENYNQHFTIRDLANKVCISVTSLKSCFKDVYGDTIYGYKKRCRMQKAREMLLETDYKVYEIALMVGYNEVAMFSKAFKKTFNMTPTEYRRIKIK